MTSQTFTISNMTCNSCVMHIEELEDTLPGVNKIEVNFKKHKMVAEFDETKITSQVIADSVINLGYPTVLAETPAKKGFLPWKR